MIEYSLIKLDDLIVSLGVKKFLGKEFCINNGSYSEDNLRTIIDYILNYVKSEEKKILNNETIGVGSWILKFVFSDDYIEIHELKDIVNGENIYEFNLDYIIRFINEQQNIARKYNVKLDIPRIGQKIAFSKEICEGSEINAVRYIAPEHMSGWYLTSNSYNGDINSLQVDYLYFLLKKRPDLAGYLSLPFGYRFFKSNNETDVWFDEEVLKG